MKYFVTGGAGFIGSNMVDRILKDRSNEVTIYDNFCSGRRAYVKHYLKDKRFRLIKGDVLDLELLKNAIKGHNFVFHFVANPDIVKSMVETDLDLKLGIIATYNVLEAMRVNGIKMIADVGLLFDKHWTYKKYLLRYRIRALTIFTTSLKKIAP